MRNAILGATLVLLSSTFVLAQNSQREAAAFVAQAEKELGDFSVIAGRAEWVNATYLTDDRTRWQRSSGHGGRR